MVAIHDLSVYQMYRLQSLHPAFSDDWKQVLQDILLILDENGQKSVYQRILLPRGIVFNDDSKKFEYKKPIRYQEFLKKQSIQNPKIRQIVEKIQNLFSLPA